MLRINVISHVRPTVTLAVNLFFDQTNGKMASKHSQMLQFILFSNLTWEGHVLLFCAGTWCAAPVKTSVERRVRPTDENCAVPKLLLAVGFSLWLRHIVHLHSEGGSWGRLVSVYRQFYLCLGVGRYGRQVHVPHLLREVQLHHLLLDHQALFNVPPLVLELYDGLGVPVERRHRRAHAGAKGAPR